MSRKGLPIQSRYVKPGDLDELQRALDRRRENESALREQERSRAQIIRALGRGYVDESSKA